MAQPPIRCPSQTRQPPPRSVRVAKIDHRGGPIRLPSHRNRLYYRYWRGKLVVSAWPQKLQKEPSPRQAAARQLMKEAADAAKHVDPQQVELSYFWSNGTQALPRDLLFQSFYGRLGFIIDTPERKIYPMAALQDVSAVLDALGLNDGDMLYRADKYWTALPIGLEGQVLKVNADGLPEWQPDGGGGVSFSGAAVKRTSNYALAAATTIGIPWQAAEYDTDGFWDAGTPSRLTVPAGVTMVSCSGALYGTASVSNQLISTLVLNGSRTELTPSQECDTPGNDAVSFSSGPIPVSEGDYFELYAYSSLARTINTLSTFLSLQVLAVS